LSVNNLILKEKCLQLGRVNQSYMEKYGELDESSLIENYRDEPDVLQEMIGAMQIKMGVINQKEKELDERKAVIREQEEDNFKKAAYLKNLFEEFGREESELNAKKQDFFQQKAALMDLERKCKEKSELLAAKEQELVKYREELIEREKITTEKILRLPVRNQRRVSTNAFAFDIQQLFK
jgi:chromosome segregation ATPase